MKRISNISYMITKELFFILQDEMMRTHLPLYVSFNQLDFTFSATPCYSRMDHEFTNVPYLSKTANIDEHVLKLSIHYSRILPTTHYYRRIKNVCVESKHISLDIVGIELNL